MKPVSILLYGGRFHGKVILNTQINKTPRHSPPPARGRIINAREMPSSMIAVKCVQDKENCGYMGAGLIDSVNYDNEKSLGFPHYYNTELKMLNPLEVKNERYLTYAIKEIPKALLYLLNVSKQISLVRFNITRQIEPSLEYHGGLIFRNTLFQLFSFEFHRRGMVYMLALPDMVDWTVNKHSLRINQCKVIKLDTTYNIEIEKAMNEGDVNGLFRFIEGI